MNIYKFEFRKYLKSNIIWTISIIAVLFLFVSLFPTYSKEAEQFEKLISQFPEAFIKAMGLNNMSVSHIIGYYSFAFSYILLIGGIFAMKLGLDITSKESRDKTSDFLLVKPLRRANILTPKIMASLTHIVIMNVLFFVFAIIAVEAFKKADYNFTDFLLLTLSLFFVQLFLFSLGILIGTIVNKLKSVLPVTLGVVFGFYVLYLFNQTVEDEKYSYLSPFGFFDSGYITENSAYSVSHLITSISLTVIFIVASYVIYQKKDIPSV
ncbi:ABC transporter permease subunit [Vallitalea guaymasensis]|uniref:ABC transporter permease subunit n=1 Tax=Vallitalea guaymasensis TaxID=1185412 RepID=A0A8J8MD77_9FIRM|nr:ABC transporter permease subunit [Vallitalea guaymasensis]QUH30679.1 ABC transporter permease subunit [Vallitalea guaymasensis]